MRDTEDLSPRDICLCRYAPPAPHSPFFASLYLFVKKKRRNEETTARREVYRTPYWWKEKIVGLGLKTSEHHLQISSLKQRALTLNQTLFVCISILVTSNSFTLRHLTFLSLNSTILEPSFFSELWNIMPSNFNFTRIYSQIN